jgi:hypothetical protein
VRGSRHTSTWSKGLLSREHPRNGSMFGCESILPRREAKVLSEQTAEMGGAVETPAHANVRDRTTCLPVVAEVCRAAGKATTPDVVRHRTGRIVREGAMNAADRDAGGRSDRIDRELGVRELRFDEGLQPRSLQILVKERLRRFELLAHCGPHKFWNEPSQPGLARVTQGAHLPERLRQRGVQDARSPVTPRQRWAALRAIRPENSGSDGRSKRKVRFSFRASEDEIRIGPETSRRHQSPGASGCKRF